MAFSKTLRQAIDVLRLLPGGVQAGDTVVVSPPADLKDGSRITPAKPKE